jgi:hypothetical protein
MVVSAVGDELALAHPGGYTEPAVAAVLIGEPALFLVGALLLKFSVFGVWSPARATGLLLVLGLRCNAGLSISTRRPGYRHSRSGRRLGDSVAAPSREVGPSIRGSISDPANTTPV